MAHNQLDKLGTALTVINALLTDPSYDEKLIHNSSSVSAVSKRHNARIRGKRDTTRLVSLHYICNLKRIDDGER
jgi:hypothetical protein